MLPFPEFVAGSNFRKYVSPSESFDRKPGVTPCVFPPMTVSVPRAGPSPRFAPRISCSGEIAFMPIRLVNQLESGTSPSVLIFTARLLFPLAGLEERILEKIVIVVYFSAWNYGNRQVIAINSDGVVRAEDLSALEECRMPVSASRKMSALENIFELDECTSSLPASRDVNSPKHGFRSVETKAQAIGCFKIF